MSFMLRLLPAVMAAAIAVPAAAVTTYTFDLTPAMEVPPALLSSGSGSGTLTLSDDENTLTAAGTFANLFGPSADGHLHCCAPIGANGPVAVPFTITTGSTSGSIGGVFDLTASATYTAEFLQNYASVADARTGLINGLNGGLAYVNVHSTQYPSGEIRGQVLLSDGTGGTGSTVPEPSEWALLGVGFAIVGTAARRRSTPHVMA